MAGCPEQGIPVVGVTAHRVVEVIATELWGVVLISVALKKNYPVWVECCSNDNPPVLVWEAAGMVGRASCMRQESGLPRPAMAGAGGWVKVR